MTESLADVARKFRDIVRSCFHYRPGRLAKGTLAMTVGIGIRTTLQTLVFLIVARVLGAKDYGALTAVLAVASALGGLSGSGVQMLLVRDVARNQKNFPLAWAKVLHAFVWTSIPLLIFYFLLINWILSLEISWLVIVFLGLSEIVFNPVSAAAVQAHQGHEQIERAAWLVSLPVLTRMFGASMFFSFSLVDSGEVNLLLWAIIYSIASLLATAYAVFSVQRAYGMPARISSQSLLSSFREGLLFALGGLALRVYADIDKAMLARMGSLETTGIYSAAYRMVDMAGVPLQSLLTAAIPRFFREGEKGIGAVAVYALKIFPAPLAYAAFVSLLLYFAAPVVPWILGESFKSSIEALRWLSCLPICMLPRQILQTALTAGGRQRSALTVVLIGSCINILLNLALIPKWDWQGAVIATYATEVAVSLVMVVQLRVEHRLKA